MKTLIFLTLLSIAGSAIATQPTNEPPIHSQSQQSSADNATVVDEATPPALSATPTEFIVRTTVVTKQQAESEVHYETQRLVQ